MSLYSYLVPCLVKDVCYFSTQSLVTSIAGARFGSTVSTIGFVVHFNVLSIRESFVALSMSVR